MCGFFFFSSNFAWVSQWFRLLVWWASQWFRLLVWWASYSSSYIYFDVFCGNIPNLRINTSCLFISVGEEKVNTYLPPCNVGTLSSFRLATSADLLMRMCLFRTATLCTYLRTKKETNKQRTNKERKNVTWILSYLTMLYLMRLLFNFDLRLCERMIAYLALGSVVHRASYVIDTRDSSRAKAAGAWADHSLPWCEEGQIYPNLFQWLNKMLSLPWSTTY